MGIPKALSTILAGQADAALVASSALIKANKAGAPTIVSAEGLVQPTLIMTTTEKFAKEHPDIVARVNKVYKQALDWMNKNLEKTAEMGAKEHGISVENSKTLISRSHYFSAMTAQDVKDLEVNKKFLKENNMMRKDVDTANLILPVAFE